MPTFCIASPTQYDVYDRVERIYVELGSANDLFSVFQVVLGESRADNAEVGGEFCNEVPDYNAYMYYEPNPTSHALLKYWLRGYTIISYCNTIIDSTHLGDFNEALKQRYIAEAKFIRSLIIFTLANTFGAVPYPVHSFEWPTGGVYNDYFESNKVPFEVLSLSDIYQQIETDLIEAISVLPLRSELNHPTSFRATSGAAQALLGGCNPKMW